MIGYEIKRRHYFSTLFLEVYIFERYKIAIKFNVSLKRHVKVVFNYKNNNSL